MANEFCHNAKFRGCGNKEKVANITKSSSQKGEKPKSMDLTFVDDGYIKINKLTIPDPKGPSLVMKTKHV